MPTNHKKECTKDWCYCIDSQGDPICDCGEPGYACKCDKLEDYDPIYELHLQRTLISKIGPK